MCLQNTINLLLILHIFSEASIDSQCDLISGQCQCKPGVSGQKCERCNTGFWNLGPNGM